MESGVEVNEGSRMVGMARSSDSVTLSGKLARK